MKFHKLVVYSNWCHVDRLDGENFNEGEEIEIKWPNGDTQPYTAGVQRRAMKEMDHGGPVSVSDVRVWITETVRGVDVKIYLRDIRDQIKIRKTAQE